MLSFQTNVNSLVAQQNLSVNNTFQSKTIQQLTSGYRINSSGDDAAGLAVANKYRSSIAELTQGVANGNDGVAQLQIMDGGMNNIAQMLDRLKTLAMQSASQTFTGNRTTLNSEFQTDIQEINRQAQSIGLNTGGSFAKSLAVYLGAGSGSQSATNSVVNVDLSKATVDSLSFGLSGFSSTGNSSVDIGPGGGITSVASILGNTANQATETQAGYTQFYFTGPSFANTTGTSRVAVSVNLSGVTDANSLATAINAAIQTAGNGISQQSTAFKNASLQASVYVDSKGASHLQFTSSSAAFQVEAGDSMANALLGNIDGTGAAGAGLSVAAQVATTAANGAVGAKLQTNPFANSALVASTGAEATAAIEVSTNGGSSWTSYGVNIGAADTAAAIKVKIDAALGGGVTATLDNNNHLIFNYSGASTGPLLVTSINDAHNTLGLGATGAAPVTASAIGASENVTLNLSIGGVAQTPVFVSIAGTETSGAAIATAVQTGLTSSGITGVTASYSSGQLKLTATDPAQANSISVQAAGDTNNFLGLGTFGSPTTSVTGVQIANTASATQNIEIAIGGQVATFANVSTGTSESAALSNLNSAFQGNALTKAAGITAVDSGGYIRLVSNGTGFAVNVYGATDAGHHGFGLTNDDAAGVASSTAPPVVLASAQASTVANGVTPSLDANGTATSGFVHFNGISVTGASQTLTLAAPDSSGVMHSISFSLTSATAGNIDAALSAINNQLLQSNDPTLQHIVAVKDQGTGTYNATTNPNGNGGAVGTEGIRFVTSLPSFSLSLGTTALGAGTLTGAGKYTQGLYTISADTLSSVQGGGVINSTQNGVGSTADISTIQNAQTAVTAITSAVTALGAAQAAVGKSQNVLNYAISLAQSQITNFSAAQAQIRDADVAAQAANLSKAQVLQQASIAAMAQANSAPQAILALLRG